MTADVSLARLLEIEVGSPLIATRRGLSHRRSGGPTRFFEGYFRADRCCYTVQLNRGSGKPIVSTSPGDARTKRSRSASSRR
jgi:hypothetical protein